MDFKKKYLKYKTKYLLNGGSYGFDEKIKSDKVEYEKYRAKEEHEQKIADVELITYIKENCKNINFDFNNDEIYNFYDLKNLSINNNLEYIKNIYENNKYIELRKYNNEKKLIFGCGNKRLDCGNLYPCSDDDEKQEYDMFHSHENAYTIDTTLIANPSIVSFFDETSNYEKSLPDNSFDLIIFEGTGSAKYNPNEIKRLLNNKTYSFCIDMRRDGLYYLFSTYIGNKYFQYS